MVSHGFSKWCRISSIHSSTSRKLVLIRTFKHAESTSDRLHGLSAATIVSTQGCANSCRDLKKCLRCASTTQAKSFPNSYNNFNQVCKPHWHLCVGFPGSGAQYVFIRIRVHEWRKMNTLLSAGMRCGKLCLWKSPESFLCRMAAATTTVPFQVKFSVLDALEARRLPAQSRARDSVPSP